MSNTTTTAKANTMAELSAMSYLSKNNINLGDIIQQSAEDRAKGYIPEGYKLLSRCHALFYLAIMGGESKREGSTKGHVYRDESGKVNNKLLAKDLAQLLLDFRNNVPTTASITMLEI